MALCACGKEAERNREQCRDCKDRDFWKNHRVVTVNGADMIATRGDEDSPSELL